MRVATSITENRGKGPVEIDPDRDGLPDRRLTYGSREVKAEKLR
jgi:hypothetical protein